jgi:Tol biopolymer transport system component
MDDQGGSPVNLTNSQDVLELGPKWSPDGTRVAYINWVPGAGSDIWVMNADGSGHVNLTDNPSADGVMAWSPD